MKTLLVKRHLVSLGLAFAAGLLVSIFWDRNRGEEPDQKNVAEPGETVPDFYTCSMHPQIQRPEPGLCPLCDMELIPVYSGQDRFSTSSSMEMSPREIKLAEVQTTPVSRKFVTAEIRMVGRLDYDESRVVSVTARAAGRLDQLYVDYQGAPVQEGDHLVYYYSPEILQAQEELLSSMRAAQSLGSGVAPEALERIRSTIRSARDKLLLWGLTEAQVNEIEQRGTASDHVTLYSPISGVVVEKNAVEGKYMNTGDEIYKIADLSRVWALLDAYESDLMWLHYGQEVELTTDAYPGSVFRGQVAFIDPVLNPKTRTVRVRVNLDNPEKRLKPEMFVRATVRSRVASEGRIMDPGLAGKWISPMHPEIIKDEPGDCDICGMALVSAESLGYVAADEQQAPVVIPSTAPLITGKRAVVYIAEGNGKFTGREIELGPRAGDYYLVESGLESGEQVVTQGAFKIDSALQILARPSMMSLSTQEAVDLTSRRIQLEEEAGSYLGEIAEHYLAVSSSLSRDDLEGARSVIREMEFPVAQLSSYGLIGDSLRFWKKLEGELSSEIEVLQNAETIESARKAFRDLSKTMLHVTEHFIIPSNLNLHRFHCPMAFQGQGADWIQAAGPTENPFYGSRMFGCGKMEEQRIAASAEAQEGEER